MSTKKQKQKIQTIVSSIFIVFLILAVVTVGLIGWFSKGFTDFNIDNWKNITSEQTEETTTESKNQVSPMECEIINSQNLLLASSNSVQNSNGIWSRDITATVLPEDTTNKKVNWTVSWEDGSTLSNEDVSNYIKLTVKGDNACTIQCIKAFPKNKILVTAKTDIGDASAVCIVNYIGMPETVSLSGSYNVMRNNSFGVNFNALLPGQSYDFDITFDNSLHCVTDEYDPTHVLGAGDEYWNHLDVKISGQGRYEYYPADDEDWEAYEIDLSNYVTESDLKEFVTIKTTRNKLTITVKKAFSEGEQIFGERPYIKYLDGKTPYFCIQVIDRDHPNLISNKINFSPVVVANNIKLSNNTITF